MTQAHSTRAPNTKDTEGRCMGSPRTSNDSDSYTAADRLIAATPRTSIDVEAGAVETQVPLPAAPSGTCSTAAPVCRPAPVYRPGDYPTHSADCMCRPGCRQSTGWRFVKEGAIATTMAMFVFHLCLSCIFLNWRQSAGFFAPDKPSSTTAGVPVIATGVLQPQYDPMEIKFIHSELDILKATIANIDVKMDDMNATLHAVIIDGGNDSDRSNAKIASSGEGVPVQTVPVRPPTNPSNSSLSSSSSSLPSSPLSSSSSSSSSSPLSTSQAVIYLISVLSTIFSGLGIIVCAMTMCHGCERIYVGAEYLNKSTIWSFSPLGAVMGLVIILFTGSSSLDQVVLTQMWGLVIGLNLGVAWTAIDTAAAACS